MTRVRISLFVPAILAIAFSNDALMAEPVSVPGFVGQYCAECHDATTSSGGLNLTRIVSADAAEHSADWETVIRQLRGRHMPPIGKPRPDNAGYQQIVSELESVLDRAAKAKPNPGRTDTVRRLNRTEYQNAIRDLLTLDIDAAAYLPQDEASHGFDNVTVGELSPTLLDRYITAARKIGKLAVGGSQASLGGDTIRVRPDITQEERIEGLPFGTRGGALIHYTFPQDGEYEIEIRLARDRNEHVEGLTESHDVEILLDRGLVKSFTVTPPPGRLDFKQVDEHLKTRVPVAAGPHDLGVTFIKEPSSLIETLRQPYNSHFNTHRHPRISPAVYQVSITGPYDAKGPGDSPSRRRVFITRPHAPQEEETCARQILATLTRRAYRRPVGDADVNRLMAFYRTARNDSDFDGGIEAALGALLVGPEFLFRVEREPAGLPPRTAYPISDLELASRLSFFLWSSIPDDELLDLAERGELHQRHVLANQTRRMLADWRSQSLVNNFADQWLHLRNLESITPDGRKFPDFDHNLRTAFRRETELLFDEVLRQDQSALKILKSDHTWLNERLARHYAIPHVYGTHFRPVKVSADGQRGGLLRHGGILTVTSYATRTSPVIRGKWILENLLGTPPPPPPPNVPALDDNTVLASLPVRERLARHRANAACASCHNLMDPVGFSLENFDAVGRWRTMEEGYPVDSTGGLPDGGKFAGVAGLEAGLLNRPDLFVSTLTEKLLKFALGRGIEHYDAPAVREIMRTASDNDYRFSAIISGIVNSVPFQMRSSQ